MNEVTWKIQNIDSDNKVHVYYTDGTNENTVWYKWEGNMDALTLRIQQEAAAYRDIWWKQHELDEEQKAALLALSGNSSSVPVSSPTTTIEIL